MHIRAIIIAVVLAAGVFAPSVSAQNQLSTEEAPSAGVGVNTESETRKPLTTKLQIPIPFVPTNCELIDNAGKPKLDSNNKAIPTVCDLTDYIRGVYRLLIGLAALFAVLMFIAGGYQWIVSGGSADKTGAAKKRIFSAVIGLILALLSYVILNAITPRLVSLRLPEVTPVRTIGFDNRNGCNDPQNTVVTEFCKDKVNCLADASAKFPKFTRSLDEAKCGSQFLVSDDLKNVSGSCGGDVCFDADGNRQRDMACIAGKCVNSIMYGDIKWEPDNGYVDYLELYVVCNGRSSIGLEVSELNTVEKASAYRLPNELAPPVTGPSTFGSFSSDQELQPKYKVYGDQCGSGVKGYVLKAQINNDCYATATEDDDFAVGRSCNSPITTGEAENIVYDFDDIDWRKVKGELLFQPKDFDEGAFRCDLNIQRNRFPTKSLSGFTLTNLLTAGGVVESSCPVQNNEL